MTKLGQLYSLFDSVKLPENLPYTQCSKWELKFLYLVVSTTSQARTASSNWAPEAADRRTRSRSACTRAPCSTR